MAEFEKVDSEWVKETADGGVCGGREYVVHWQLMAECEEGESA